MTRRGSHVAFGLALVLTTLILLTPASVVAALTGVPVDDRAVSVPGADKLVHALLFAALALLAPPFRLALPGLAAYAVATELLQGLVPGRSPDALDLIADLVGLAAGAVAARRFASRKG